MIAGGTAAAAVLLAALAGCKPSNPEGFTEQQLKGMDRQATILKNAGGDWNKVSADDKAFLVKGMGSEESAKQYVRNAGGGDGRAPAGQFGPPPGAGGPPPAPRK
jgi:hypothetical protein